MKNKNVDQANILDHYSKYVLKNNSKPANIYSFCEEHGMSEAEFYEYYTSFEQLEADFLVFFYQETQRLLAADENYNQYLPKDKMLAFYFTFFEQLTLNRSLVMYLLGHQKNALDNVKKLHPLRKEYLKFVSGLGVSEPLMDEKAEKFEKFRKKGIEEIFWGHFLTTLKFWMDDSSAGFEKTDIYIEKSLDTSFELLEVKPLKKLFDLGKFLFKEKINLN